MFTEQQLRTLERRLLAACCDATVWGGGWYALFRTFSRPADERTIAVWLPAAVVLLVVAATEVLTGITPGKWLTGLRVFGSDSGPGSGPASGAGATRPPIASLLLRGALRLLPLAILLLALPATSPTFHLAAFTTAGTIATCYLCAAYLTFIRRGLSPFDLAAGTVVTRRAGSSRS